jgi:hypothetical protein
MKTYDAQGPLTIAYYMGLVDFPTPNLASAVQRPAGVSHCRVEEIHVAVTETFNGTSNPGHVLIGTAADPDKFADLDMGVAAITDGYGTNDFPAAIKEAGEFIDLDRDGDAGVSLDQLEVVTTPMVDAGTETGIGHVTVVLSWY